MPTSISETQTWYEGTNQVGEDVRLLARHMGWQMIHLGRKMSLISTPMGAWLQQYGEMFINGQMDQLIRERIEDKSARHVMLHMDMEVMFATVGAALGLGTTDVDAAYQALVNGKWAMHKSDGTYTLDDRGVPLPPEGWLPPDLEEYLK